MRALIFDLDGTLVDTVYAHVFAWQKALDEAGMPIDGWRIHRRIGMSGGLFARAVAREVGRPLEPDETEAIQERHGQLYRELLPERRPLPGAVQILRELRELEVPHGIATSGRRWGLLSTARTNTPILSGAHESDSAEVIAVASRDRDRAVAYAAEHGIERAYGSYPALLGDPDVDAVYISLPNSLHLEWA